MEQLLKQLAEIHLKSLPNMPVTYLVYLNFV